MQSLTKPLSPVRRPWWPVVVDLSPLILWIQEPHIDPLTTVDVWQIPQRPKWEPNDTNQEKAMTFWKWLFFSRSFVEQFCYDFLAVNFLNLLCEFRFWPTESALLTITNSLPTSIGDNSNYIVKSYVSACLHFLAKVGWGAGTVNHDNDVPKPLELETARPWLKVDWSISGDFKRPEYQNAGSYRSGHCE